MTIATIIGQFAAIAVSAVMALTVWLGGTETNGQAATDAEAGQTPAICLFAIF